MKFVLASDLHIERGPISIPDNPGADCLILAGDIVNFCLLKKRGQKYEYVKEFFRTVSRQYKDVIWVPGNHEYWGCYGMKKSVTDTQAWLSKENLSNVHLMQNRSIILGGIPIHCATLWTDVNKGDPLVSFLVQNGMNDYQYIRDTKKITVAKTRQLNHESSEFLQAAISDDVPCVVVTHHQPMIELINGGYDRGAMDFAYGNTKLYSMIENSSNIKVWCSGHSHQQTDVEVFDTRFLTNCRGYDGYEPNLNNSFKLMEFSVEV